MYRSLFQANFHLNIVGILFYLLSWRKFCRQWWLLTLISVINQSGFSINSYWLLNRSRQEVVLASQNAYLIKVSCVKSWMDMMHYLLPGQEPGFEENSEVYNVTSLKWIKRVLTSEVCNRRYNFNNLFYNEIRF